MAGEALLLVPLCITGLKLLGCQNSKLTFQWRVPSGIFIVQLRRCQLLPTLYPLPEGSTSIAYHQIKWIPDSLSVFNSIKQWLSAVTLRFCHKWRGKMGRQKAFFRKIE